MSVLIEKSVLFPFVRKQSHSHQGPVGEDEIDDNFINSIVLHDEFIRKACKINKDYFFYLMFSYN